MFTSFSHKWKKKNIKNFASKIKAFRNDCNSQLIDWTWKPVFKTVFRMIVMIRVSIDIKRNTWNVQRNKTRTQANDNEFENDFIIVNLTWAAYVLHKTHTKKKNDLKTYFFYLFVGCYFAVHIISFVCKINGTWSRTEYQNALAKECTRKFMNGISTK